MNLNNNEQEIIINDKETGAVAYLVIHNTVNGMTTGGLRIGNSVSLEEIRKLAFIMSLKIKAYNLPVGGGKCGLKLPDGISQQERTEILLRLAERFRGVLTNTFILGEDMGSIPSEIDMMYKHIGTSQIMVSIELLKRAKVKNYLRYIPNFILKNLVSSYKSYGTDITAHTVLCSLKAISQAKNYNLNSMQIALQGVGSIGKKIIEYCKNEKLTIVKVADLNGCIYSPHGLDLDGVLKAISERGIIDRAMLKKSCDFEELHRDEWFKGKSDILIPAAIPDAFNKENRNEVSTKIILEAANIPMDIETDQYFYYKGITVIPDFIASSGIPCSFGLIAAGRVQPYNIPEIYKIVNKMIGEVVNTGYSISNKDGVSIRKALYNHLGII